MHQKYFPSSTDATSINAFLPRLRNILNHDPNFSPPMAICDITTQCRNQPNDLGVSKNVWDVFYLIAFIGKRLQKHSNTLVHVRITAPPAQVTNRPRPLACRWPLSYSDGAPSDPPTTRVFPGSRHSRSLDQNHVEATKNSSCCGSDV